MELVFSGRGMKVGGDLLKLESHFVCLLVFFFFSLPSELCWTRTGRVWGYLTKLFFLLVPSFLYVAGDSVSHLSFAVCEPHGFFSGPICFIHPGMSSCSSQRYLRTVLGNWRSKHIIQTYTARPVSHCLLVYWDMVSLCNPGCPGLGYID